MLSSLFVFDDDDEINADDDGDREEADKPNLENRKRFFSLDQNNPKRAKPSRKSRKHMFLIIPTI